MKNGIGGTHALQTTKLTFELKPRLLMLLALILPKAQLAAPAMVKPNPRAVMLWSSLLSAIKVKPNPAIKKAHT